MNFISKYYRILIALLLSTMIAIAHAGLFEDEEARHAVLELRQKITAIEAAETQSNYNMLDLQSQLMQMKDGNAKLRGEVESLQNEVTRLQKTLTDYYASADERLKKLEPKLVMVEGKEGLVMPAEQNDYDAALKFFRDSDTKNAINFFHAFIKHYPSSLYLPLAQFWLGNALYVQRDYKAAMTNLQSMIRLFPAHLKVPDAWAVIGSIQFETGQKAQARKTFEYIIANHPGTEAATSAQQRLATLK